MKSNYKRLGNYIKAVNDRNRDLKATELLGINIDKYFMPSVANTIGTDLSAYKIVQHNQFACNRMHVGRDYRIPVALSTREKPFMVSPAYDVFEIINPKVLLPEYLMMWFSRKEFDRNAWFYTDADVRGGLPWKAFCDMQLPIPSPEKQKEIVAEYNTIQSRIALNNSLIQKLEATAQAIYKHWFVAFEFPNEEGKPYRSSGGEMEFNEKLKIEVPKGWMIDKVGNNVMLSQGIQVEVEDQFLERVIGYNRFLRIIDFTPYTEEPARYVNIQDNRYYCSKDEVAMIRYGDAGTVCRRLEGIIANNLFKISPKNSLTNNFLFYYLKEEKIQKEIRTSAASSTMPAITHTAIKDLFIVIPSEDLIRKFDSLTAITENNINLKIIENEKLKDITKIILSKLATIETTKPQLATA